MNAAARRGRLNGRRSTERARPYLERLETRLAPAGVSFASQETFATGNAPNSVAVADFNGDGKPDLVVANQNDNTVSVLLNTTAAGATTTSFAPPQTFATGSEPTYVMVTDVNRDGKPDLVVANAHSNSVSVLLNTTAAGASTPSFAAQQTFATGTFPDSLAVADFNGDGKPDLVVANDLSNTMSVLLNTTATGASTPSFTIQETFATGGDPASVAVADFNGDGKPDLVVANNASHTVSVLLNTTTPGASNSSFTAQQTFAIGILPFSVTVADVNGDGSPDLVVANSNSNTVSVLLNTTAPGASTPSFTAQETFDTGMSPSTVTVADFNGDGKPDLVVANFTSNTVSVLLNTTPFLTLVTTASPAVTLGTIAPTLSDSALLSGDTNPTGSITFTLTGPGGLSFTQTDTVAGNGTYTASDTLPTTGTVAGTYTWSAIYSGDANNSSAQDQGGAGEQTVVSLPVPSLVTTASPAVTLGTMAPTLSDSALLSGGLSPTGTITFTLTGPGGFSFTQTDTVAGTGTYTAGDTLSTSGTVAGTYTWSAIYSGDSNNGSTADQGGTAEQTIVSAASPSLVTLASGAVTLGTKAPILSNSAALSGGFFENGSITFMLTGPGGFSFTQTDTVSGDGTYTAGDTLPTSGTVVGTYTWSAHYSGDSNNQSANDQGGTAEQTIVSAGSPSLVTLASGAVTLGTTVPTLIDRAALTGGFFETGSITFTLTGPGGFSFTHTDTVSGNGTYTAGDTLPTPGTVVGAYTWSAHYSGDSNNNSANDQGGTTEQTIVSEGSPSLVTLSSGAVTLGTTAPTMSDRAALSGGFFVSGSITFTLTGPGGFSFTHTDTVAGNGTYTASDTLPTTGTVAGTYTWSAHYSGDSNNNSASDQGGAAEQAIVSPGSPSLATLASGAVTLGTTAPTLSDRAALTGGFFDTGSITFTLTGPGGFSFTHTDTVAGAGTYTASDTLPTLGAVGGTYTWSAYYSGDSNNHSANDQGGAAEQTVVSLPAPSLVTTASSPVTLGTMAPTLSDSALLSGRGSPTGTITFTLTGPGGFSFTHTDTVSGNGTYTASDTLPTSGTVAGTYTWSAHYSGDINNNSANDQGGTAEQTVVSKANPRVVATANGGNQGTTASTLSDSAVLSGGFFEKGTITFTLTGPRGFSFTQTDTVAGNGTYTAAHMLPTMGTVAGTYKWSAHYSGDANNASADAPSSTVTVSLIATGSGLGMLPQIKLYTPTGFKTGTTFASLLAYSPTFMGGVRVAVADFNGDGVPDLIVAPAGVQTTATDVNGNALATPIFDFSAGMVPEIKVIDGTKLGMVDANGEIANAALLADFLAYPSSFIAGVFVAAADFNGDGKADIVTGPDATGMAPVAGTMGQYNGIVRVFVSGNSTLLNGPSGVPATPNYQFRAYNPYFGGGTRVAAGDVTGDGVSDIVTGPGIWSGPDIRVFDGTKLLTADYTQHFAPGREFYGYAVGYYGGVNLSLGDLNGDGRQDIILGTSGYGGPEVKAVDGTKTGMLSSGSVISNSALLADFNAFGPAAYSGGARVSFVSDLDGTIGGDILVAAGPKINVNTEALIGPEVAVFPGLGINTSPLDEFFAYAPQTFEGGVFIGGN
jgi:hypothetical protein